MKSLKLLFCLILVAPFAFSQNSYTAFNPNSSATSVSLSWLNDIPRIRIAGSGLGNNTGFDIQTLADRSLLRVLYNGNVGIGTTTPAYKLQINGNDNVESSVGIYAFSGDPLIRTFKARGTQASPSTILKDDVISGIVGHGYSSGFSTASNAGMKFNAAEDWTTTANGTNIFFETTSPGTTVRSEKVRIDGNGKVGIGTAAPVSKLQINHTGTLGNKFLPSSAYVTISDGSQSMIFDPNEIISNEGIHFGKPFGGTFDFRNVSATTSTVLMTIDQAGGLALGVAAVPTGYKMAVAGNIIAEGVNIMLQSAPWPDYVFEKEYKLKPLSELASYINEHKHLPDVPSAEDVIKNGINVGNMDALLLKKIEEITLYMIDLKKENEEQKVKIEQLEHLIKK